MRALRFYVRALFCALACCCSYVPAQQASQNQGLDAPATDLPWQRYLALPEGAIPEGVQPPWRQQAQILRELRERVLQPESAAMPELSEEQLTQIDEALRSWQSAFGERGFPSAEEFPADWADRLLSNPAARAQAELLLEQYARQRRLPPGSLSPFGPELPLAGAARPTQAETPSGTASKPATMRQPASGRSSGQPPAKPSSTTGQLNDNPRGQPAVANTEGSRQSGGQVSRSRSNSEVPSSQRQSPSAEQMQAMRKLIEQLSAVDRSQRMTGQPQPGAAARPPAGDQPGLPRAVNHADALTETAQPASASEAASAAQRGASQPAAQRTASQSAIASQPARPSQQESRSTSTSPAASTSPFLPPSKSGKPEQAESLAAQPERKPTATRPSAARAPTSTPPSTPNPELENPLRGMPLPAGLGRAAESTDRPTVARAAPNQAEGGESGETRVGGSSPSNTGGSPADGRSMSSRIPVREQVERFGLGQTLQQIVEKTLQEQGADPQSGNIFESLRDITSRGLLTQASPNRPVSAPPTTAVGQRQVGVSQPPPRPRIDSSASRAVPPATEQGVSKLAADVWKAISRVPDRQASSSGRSAQADRGSTRLGFHFGIQQWAVLFGAFALCGLLLLLARRRMPPTMEKQEHHSELARQWLDQGMRSRQDVVHAFHRCVLGQPDPPAAWWNHRRAAQQCTLTSPQLGSAINELANIYEQARYLPSSVELTPEQLACATRAYSQCAPG